MMRSAPRARPRLRLRWTRVAVAAVLALTASLRDAAAQEEDIVDGVAVRFYSAETGGVSRPRFIMQRVLAFEARIQAKVEDGGARAYQDRHVRAAMDQHIAEELLVALPLERAPDEAEIARVSVDLREGLVQRIGGDVVLRELAEMERISEAELGALFRRRARAALYVERAVLPILYPSEEQLRDVYRTAPHPYKSQKFEEARLPFARWYVDERLRAAETAFLQAARSRVKIAATR
ncbi:hypothetical protein [Pendulispora albinea]|uniref:Uncharacterized protein n=1 Tax=Pendulispora albinea TaxID=2741071 RepID=A0ABZ2LNF3_9BACT